MKLGSIPAVLAAAALAASAALPGQALAGVPMHVGTPDPVVAGMMAPTPIRLSLDKALEYVIPGTWLIEIKGAPPQNQFVTWAPGSSWIQAVEDMASATNSDIEINWERRLLRFQGKILRQPSTSPTIVIAPKGLVMPSPPEPVAPPVLVTAPAPEPQALPSPPPPPSIAMGGATAFPPGADPSAEFTVTNPEAVQIVAPATAEVAAPAPAKVYADLSDFLQEEVAVDRKGAPLAEALQALLPVGWIVDVRSDDSDLSTLMLDITHVGARGPALEAIGLTENLSMIPFLEFKKLIVTRKNNKG